MTNFSETLRKALESLKSAVRPAFSGRAVGYRFDALKEAVRSRHTAAWADLRRTFREAHRAALRSLAVFSPRSVSHAWRRQELAGGFLLVFFALAIIAGMGAKVIAVNTVTIGYDDHRVRDYGETYDLISVQEKLFSESSAEPEVPKNTGPMCYPE